MIWGICNQLFDCRYCRYCQCILSFCFFHRTDHTSTCPCNANIGSNDDVCSSTSHQIKSNAHVYTYAFVCPGCHRLTSKLWDRHRFSAFWLRSKCSICSYQLNIWYVASIATSILNWFLVWGEMHGACSALATGRPGLAVLPGMAHSTIQ